VTSNCGQSENRNRARFEQKKKKKMKSTQRSDSRKREERGKVQEKSQKNGWQLKSIQDLPILSTQRCHAEEAELSQFSLDFLAQH
jgi:Mg-chelatase subunit ChlD